MKKSLIALALAAMLPAAAHAQLYYDDYDWDDAYDDYAYVEDDYVPLTGDAGLDAMLVSINARFNDEPVYYAEQLAVGTQVQPTMLRNYLVERRYAPADVYMMGQLSQLTGKSLHTVANAYEANRGQGWGAVARSLGIKPGSPQFHQLKRGGTALVATPPGRAAARTARGTGHPAAATHPGKGHGKNKDKHGGAGPKGKGKGKNK